MMVRKLIVLLIGMNMLVGVTGSVLATVWLHDMRWLVVGTLLGIAFAVVAGGTS
ncbi:hypothetical protein ABZW96_35405 [Nocardia sp. NPDC004168]|uniref:hypothetical protein n=1 Tax=Nocardia sp. NPDC004168 TaxID=3154452 RepID=UPI0033BE9D98